MIFSISSLLDCTCYETDSRTTYTPNTLPTLSNQEASVKIASVAARKEEKKSHIASMSQVDLVDFLKEKVGDRNVLYNEVTGIINLREKILAVAFISSSILDRLKGLETLVDWGNNLKLPMMYYDEATGLLS